MNSESQADRSMDENSPHQVLGIAQDASFEEIKAARDHLLQQLSQDEVQQQLVEQAYDAILMERLRLRQQGKIPVPDDIRNPERVENVETKPSSRWSLPSFKTDKTPHWVGRLIDNPEPRDVWVPLAVMSGIYAIMLVAQPNSHSLPLTLGMMATGYFVYLKERLFWRSLLIAFIALIAGLLLAEIPLAFAAGGATLDTNMTAGIVLAIMWLCSAFIR
ncbi:MAG: CPP1-like family protein [Cyanobacteria bacterium J06639_1]